MAEDKYISLTFDDGPSLKYTEKILDILKEFNVKATFFIIGKNAEEHPSLVKQIFSDGFEIGNHTYSHAFLDRLTMPEIEKEIAKTDEIIKEITGVTPTLFRPPGGRKNNAVTNVVKRLEKTTVMWSKDTRDWSCPSVESVIASATDDIKSGDIILFHDYNSGKSPTPESIRRIIPSLLSKGYKFVTVSELLEKHTPY